MAKLPMTFDAASRNQEGNDPMRLLYVLTAAMFLGLFLMGVSSYKVLDTAREQQEYGSAQSNNGMKTQRPTIPRSEVLPYLSAGYIGLTLFVFGGVGALFVLFKQMTRRF